MSCSTNIKQTFYISLNIVLFKTFNKTSIGEITVLCYVKNVLWVLICYTLEIMKYTKLIMIISHFINLFVI